MRLWRGKEALKNNKSKEELDSMEYRARKGLVHATRFAAFGHQMANKKCVHNFRVCNGMLLEIKKIEEGKDWREIESKYKSVHQKYIRETQGISKQAQKEGAKLLASVKNVGDLISVIEKIGVEGMCWFFAVRVRKWELEGEEGKEEIFHLRANSKVSPFDLKGVHLCNPLLLKKNGNSFRLLSLGWPKMRYYYPRMRLPTPSKAFLCAHSEF